MKPISRRTILRGAGACLALPWLEAMARGGSSTISSTNANTAPPLRLAYVYVPNGTWGAAWTPKSEGALTDLPPTLAPLAARTADLSVLSGLTQDPARPHGDGPGDHARAAAAFLTCAHPFKGDGSRLEVGVSADQLAAQAIGARTRLRSLELGCEAGASSGQCDSGYPCAYSANLAWSAPAAPLSKETEPRRVFERLFLGGEQHEPLELRRARLRSRASVLDFVREDAHTLEARLGAADRRKLDEYQDGLRELERRIERALAPETGDATKASALPAPPAGIPKEHAEHVRLMFDLLALAFETDSTRIATFLVANEGSNRSYAFLGAPEGHHDLSHHGSDAAKIAKLCLVDRFHAENVARFLERLAAAREGEERLLDRCMIVFGGGIGDGNKHNHDELPIVLAGRGGGLKPGRHVRFAHDTPLGGLHIALLERMGVACARLGETSGRLDGI